MKATVKRNAQNDSQFRGMAHMSIEIADESYENEIIKRMAGYGYDCQIVEESDHYVDGSALIYWMESDEVSYFKAAWKEVKKELA